MGRKALPKKQIDIIKKEFRLSGKKANKKAEKLIRTIMEGFEIPCENAVRLLVAIMALRKRS